MVMENFYKIVGAVLAPFRYAQREIENAKENLKEEARDAASNVLKIIAIVFCALFFLLFGSMSAAAAINSSSDSEWLGFAIVAGFYLAVTVGIYVWKNVTSKKKRAQEYQRDNTTTVTT
jgi:NhaP-type Na+/H+ or K+/H+ antiporter